ncbi:hypothetical protein K1T71_009605 [Dendrolimus kikuchii]|uniref:Uncharacterized protein n=1 Tax=Dendrolimus kikuchii TaxID=765133 RepID=A0ACC1CSB8_9NEOP|nr:hypothetical protein K1T71_009605 [Dendrolimus kikuchii]
MGQLYILATRVATLLILHAAGAGLASPTVLVTRYMDRVVDWLPSDNQTVYRLGEGEIKNLELNTSAILQPIVYITISPCTRDLHWSLYYGKTGPNNGHLVLEKEGSGVELSTFAIIVSPNDRYVLQLSSIKGGSTVVSARGEATRHVRMRLRVRSRRRLAANWDPSPIDPQETTYCVVASHRKNYTSLCAAQYDVRSSRLEKSNGLNSETERKKLDNASRTSTEADNKIDVEDTFNIYEGNFRSVYRRKKFGRSTKVTTDEDPVIACVGDRTHHSIENLDPSTTYYVNVFGVAKDRRSGSLLATGSVKPKTSTAKRLRENVPVKSDVRGKSVYYFKAAIGAGGGIWLTVSTCGGAIDVEVLAKGKRLYMEKNIDPHSKFFVTAPMTMSSTQETSDEGSVQFDSSSEEARLRYVIRITPSRWDRDSAVNVEVTASTTRWGINTPELVGDGAIVREIRPQRTCHSVDIAFLPAAHNATDVIRYCTIPKELATGETIICISTKRSSNKNQCVNHPQTSPAPVIVQKITGLKSGKKYAIQVTASSKGSSVPYNILYVETNSSCKEE